MVCKFINLVCKCIVSGLHREEGDCGEGRGGGGRKKVEGEGKEKDVAAELGEK